MSTYQPAVPTGSVKFNQDYANVQGNFGQIQTTYSIDHVPLTDTSGTPITNPPNGINGCHKVIHLVTASPFPPTAIAAIGELFSYQNNDTFSTDTSLYFQTGSGKNIKLTSNILPVTAANGYSFLPGGLLIQWGVVAAPGGSGTVTFATANIAFPTNLFSVQLTLSRANTGGGSGVIVINSGATFDKTQFSYLSSTAGSANLYWVALGN